MAGLRRHVSRSLIRAHGAYVNGVPELQLRTFVYPSHAYIYISIVLLTQISIQI